MQDFIVVIEDALPRALCDALLVEYRDSADWKESIVESGLVDRSIRNADAISISAAAVIERNRIARKKIDRELLKCSVNVVRKYNLLFPACRVVKDTGFELLRYRQGGFFLQHTDSYHVAPRALACSLLLNDDFEGGEFAFFDREKIYRPGRGSAIVFPANFMYPHEILPVTQGTRFSIVNWYL